MAQRCVAACAVCFGDLFLLTIALLSQVHRSPSNITEFGKAVLATNPQASHPSQAPKQTSNAFFVL
jgi:hypothetical protein